MSTKNKCPLCGQVNPDVLEEHLVALSGDYNYWGPPITVHLCVNCHHAIHRCTWALISEDSEAVLNNYFSFLKSFLPSFLFQAIREELLAAKESVVREYERVVGYDQNRRSAGKKCALCGCANPDVMEEHILSAWANYPQSISEATIDVCANCHRVLVKFYEKKTPPTSEESKILLQKYLSQFGKLLSPQARNDLVAFLGLY